MSENPTPPRSDDQLIRKIANWCIVAAAILFGATFYFFAVYGMMREEWIEQQAKEHFAAAVGLPCAALAAVLLVTVLEFHNGKIEIKGLGFEFKGAAGPLVMWTFCFLAMAAAIKLLW